MSDIAPEVPKPHGFEATLKKKVIGPVPLWLVIGIGGGVLLLLFKRKGAAAPDPTATPDPNPVDTGSGGGDVGGGVGGGGVGNTGGFEDPMPVDPLPPDPGFFWPPDPGSDPSPPASDPVYDPSAGMVPMIGGWYSPGMLSPDWQAEVARVYAGFKVPAGYDQIGPSVHQGPASRPGASQGGWTVVSASPGVRNAPAPRAPSLGGGFGSFASRFGMSGWEAIVHPYSSPAGRIAGATTSYSLWPGGSGALHVSSAAEGRTTGSRSVIAE